MDDQPADDGGEGRPKIFKSLNGWIAGATGIVVALGGLTAAWHDIFPPKQQTAADEQPATNADETDTSQAANQQAAAPDANDDPWAYSIDTGGSLRYQGGRWIETDADGKVTSYDVESVQDNMTYARAAGKGPDGADIDLRWPTKGGQAQKSTDGQVNWTDAYVLTAKPVAATSNDDAASNTDN